MRRSRKGVSFPIHRSRSAIRLTARAAISRALIIDQPHRITAKNAITITIVTIMHHSTIFWSSGFMSSGRKMMFPCMKIEGLAQGFDERFNVKDQVTCIGILNTRQVRQRCDRDLVAKAAPYQVYITRTLDRAGFGSLPCWNVEENICR